MADKVDKLLTDYFTGDLQRKISMRVDMLNTVQEIDENTGGGRAQYKYSNAVENKMITEESDAELVALRHNKKVIDSWTSGMDEVRYQVMKEMYCRHKTWDKIALDNGVSRTTMAEWRKELKFSIEGWGLLITY